MNDIDAIIQEGYFPVRILRSGDVIGIKNMLFTVSLVTGLTKDGYRSRYCYENRADAEIALSSWDGRGDPPGPWIKEKGLQRERLGPGAVQENKVDGT